MTQKVFSLAKLLIGTEDPITSQMVILIYTQTKALENWLRIQ